jgi:hypothetical protein
LNDWDLPILLDDGRNAKVTGDINVRGHPKLEWFWLAIGTGMLQTTLSMLDHATLFATCCLEMRRKHRFDKLQVGENQLASPLGL